MNRRVLLALLVAFAMLAAACGGGGDDDGPTFSDEVAPEPTADPDDSAAVASAGDDPDADQVGPTPTPVGPVEPLTGLPLTDLSLLDQPALMVKLDNHPQARPQIGLNDADQGIELLVEGITRLALVFHAGSSDPVGPVRSGRSSDPDLAANYGTTLFAWSGGNPTVRGEVRQGEIDGKLYDVGFDQLPGEYYRDGSRAVDYEHTLFTRTTPLFANAPDDLTPPRQMFAYRYDGEFHDDARPIPGVEIAWRGGVLVHWVWSDARQGWLRFQQGTPHVDSEGVQVAPPNVVLLTTPYGTSAASVISPQALTVGSGDALVLTGGQAIDGRWERAVASDPWAISDFEGGEIGLIAGQTWIGLPEAGDVSILSQSRADELLALAP